MTNWEKLKETLTAEQFADLLGFMTDPTNFGSNGCKSCPAIKDCKEDVLHCAENFVTWSKKEILPSDHELLMRIYKKWKRWNNASTAECNRLGLHRKFVTESYKVMEKFAKNIGEEQ